MIFNVSTKMEYMYLVLCTVSLCTTIVFSRKAEIDCSLPQYEETEIAINETDLPGTDVVRVTNADPSLQWTISYNGSVSRYLASFFTMVQAGNNTQILQLAKTIDLELLQVEHPTSIRLPDFSDEDLVLKLTLSCRNENGQISEKIVDISVKSVNEFSPYFLGAPFSVTISEETPVGTELYDLRSRAVDLDAGRSSLTFNITSYIIREFDGRLWVRMDPRENGRIILSEPIDFETLRVRENAYFFLNVTVTDDGGYTTSTSIQVDVEDANDQGIEFVYPNCTTPCLDVNYTVYTNESYVGVLDVFPVDILCQDLDTLNSKIEYLLLSDDAQYFTVDRKTGQLFKTVALTNDTYGYNISLLIGARETDDTSHAVETEVLVLIKERRPRKELDIHS